MKLDKLFTKLEMFFDMNSEEQKENVKKREKLLGLLMDKIDSKKEKIKDTKNKEKKEKLKEELTMLKKLSKKYQL